jgi:hypothetical protein
MLGMVAAVVACVAYGLATVLQAAGTRRAAGMRALLQPLVVAGLALDGVAFLVSLLAYRHLPLVTVQVVIAAALVVTVLTAPLAVHVPLRAQDVAVSAAVVVGLGLVSAGTSEHAARQLHGVGVTIVVVAAVALAATLGLAYRRGSAALLATLAGLGYSGVAVAARGASTSGGLWHVLFQPLTAVMVIAGAVGVLGYVRSLERGRVGLSAGVLAVVQVAVPAAVGVAALGDGLRPGAAGVLAVVGAVVAVAGCVLLGHSPAVRATA